MAKSFLKAVAAIIAVAAFFNAYAKSEQLPDYTGVIVVNAKNGDVLFERNSKKLCYPASCTKLMTLYVALDMVDSGLVKLSDKVNTTSLALSEAPSSSGLKSKDGYTLKNHFIALMVKSANDSAVMIAQHVAKYALGKVLKTGEGDAAQFVAKMNEKAAELGMKDTRYTSPNGLPPKNRKQSSYDVSTPYDLAILARAIIKNHPEVLEYTSIAECTLTTELGEKISYRNHNNLVSKPMVKMPYVDGLKTGFHNLGLFSLILTGSKNNHRAIVCITGSPSQAVRDRIAGAFLEDALNALNW
jgi:D-alanyl-D-alanine carboxypeptidase